MTPDVSAWGLVSLRAAVLLALVCAVAAIWPRRWCLARVGWLQLATVLLLAFPATIALPSIGVRVLPPPLLPAASTRAVTDSAQNRSAEPVAMPPIAPESQSAVAAPRAQLAIPPVEQVAPAHGNLPAPQDNPSATAIETSNLRRRFPWLTSGAALLPIYLVGVAFLMTRLFIGLRQIRHLQCSTTPCQDRDWQATCDELQRELGVSREVELRVSAATGSPLTCGHRRPRIVIPSQLVETADAAQRRSVLCHELAHVARHDFAWQVLMRLVQAIWWYQPLVWLLGRQLTAAQEQVCDGVCVGRCGVRHYSRTLVLVARLIQSPPQAWLAVSMARPGRLAVRLARLSNQPALTSPLISRPSRALVAAALLTLVVSCGLLYPVRGEQPAPKADTPTPPASAEAAPAKDTKATANKSAAALPLEQLVTLENAETGEPLRDITVRLQRQRFDGATRRLTIVDEAFELRTDGEGKLRVEFDELSRIEENLIAMIDLAIDGFATTNLVVPGPEDIVELEPTVAECLPGSQLLSRVFEPDGQPAKGACVLLQAEVDKYYWVHMVTTDDQGRLECRVPKQLATGLTVSSAQGAPTRLVVSAGTEKVPDIHLRRGASVSGQLLDRQGRPLAGRTVVIEAEDSQAVRGELELEEHGGSINLELQCRTNAEGKFHFGPMLGDVQVYLQRGSQGAPSEPLLPAYVKLIAGDNQWLPLMLAPTGELRGTLRTPEGAPVADMEVEVMLLPHLSNAYFTLCRTRTDAEGKYALNVPFPLSKAIVDVEEQWTRDGKRRVARAIDSNLPVVGRYLLEHYVGTPMTIDWTVTMEERDAPRSEPANQPIAADLQPLAQLEAEIKQAWAAYEHARDTAVTDELRKEIQDKLNPFDRLVARCLEFEKQHRGTRSAIGALHYVMRAGASSLSPPIKAARERAVDTLREHYVEHPDIDLLIDEFHSGAGVANSEPLLTALAGRSPFAHVRATAMLQTAEDRFATLHLAEMLAKAPPPLSAKQEQALIDAQESPSTREMLKTNFENTRRLRAALEGIKVDELRQSALDLLDRVTSNYGNASAPWRKWVNAQGEHDEPALHLVERTDDWGTPSPAQRAEILRFQQTRLRVGLIAPEIEGLDFEQRPVRLSQFRGKVVLVTFTLGNIENELYAQCQKLQQALARQDFTCLSVIPGSAGGGYSPRSIAAAGGVTWPVLVDSHDDDLARRWCQRTFPEAYLLDPDGKIVDYVSPAQGVMHLLPRIEKLLGMARATASAAGADEDQ